MRALVWAQRKERPLRDAPDYGDYFALLLRACGEATALARKATERGPAVERLRSAVHPASGSRRTEIELGGDRRPGGLVVIPHGDNLFGNLFRVLLARADLPLLLPLLLCCELLARLDASLDRVVAADADFLADGSERVPLLRERESLASLLVLLLVCVCHDASPLCVVAPGPCRVAACPDALHYATPRRRYARTFWTPVLRRSTFPQVRGRKVDHRKFLDDDQAAKRGRASASAGVTRSCSLEEIGPRRVKETKPRRGPNEENLQGQAVRHAYARVAHR